MYEDNNVQNKVKSYIPIDKIESLTKTNSEKNNTSYRDEFVKSLLHWFKNDYYTWCNKPICPSCKCECNQYLDTEKPNNDELFWLASRTEVYCCTMCKITCRFPRYNNPAILCETKTGRCGEWANLFGCILRSFDYDVRFIDNFEDHVWNEYWSDSLNQWIHVDSCENAWNTPLIYEQGWGRNLTFIIAYSITGVYDVTRRYVKDWKVIADRRSQSMIDLSNNVIAVSNNILRVELDPVVVEILSYRDLQEQMELLKVKTIQEADLIGRQSGSVEWRSQRGELK
jgi:peptide-N4-(N-acetyl-beta-glucosaminyl)asparagine amidase